MKEKYISKIDSNHTHCYFIRVPKMINGKSQPYRTDPVCHSIPKGKGTWKAALEKAVIWRNNYLKANGILHYLNKRRRDYGAMVNTGKRQKSGVIGVHRMRTTKPCGIYYGWCAIFSVRGVHKRKEWSCQMYGEEGAFKLACMHRFKKCGTLIVVDRSRLVCAPPVDFYNKKTKKLTKRCPPELQDVYPSLTNKVFI